MRRWVGWVRCRTRIAAQHYAIAVIGITVCYGCAVRLYKLPCRAVAVVQQILWIIGVGCLGKNVIANDIARFVRAIIFYKHLRIAGMVILVDEVNDSFFILLGPAVIFGSSLT